MNNISIDYYFYSIPHSAQADATALLAYTGVLNSLSGKYQLFISTVYVESNDCANFENAQSVKMTAYVMNTKKDLLVCTESQGIFKQCYAELALLFSSFLKIRNDAVYLVTHPTPNVDKLLNE